MNEKKNINVLFVEPNYKSYYVPLVFMKFSTFHKTKGDTVKYQKGINWFLQFKPDLIYITSLFTWEITIVIATIKAYQKIFPKAEIKVGGVSASLCAEQVFEETGIKTHFGIVKEVENLKPDYSLFPDIQYSIANTTKGCVRKCPWCMVHKLEPEFFEIKNWFEYIDLSKKKIVFFDNNFTASSEKFQIEVLEICRKLNKEIDFNQAIDCRLFTENLSKAFGKVKIHPLRFSMDMIGTKDACINAIELAQKYGTTDIRIYMLYNHLDKPEHFWTRTFEMVKRSVDIFPMKFQDLNAKEKGEYIGKNWSETMIKNVRTITSTIFVGGIIGCGVTLDKFYETFGKNEQEFVEIFSMDIQKFKQRAEEIKKKWFVGRLKSSHEQKDLDAW